MTHYRNYVKLITAYCYRFGLTKASTARANFKQTKSNFEAAAQRCSLKKLLLEISQNSQENICTRVSFLIKLQA